MTSNRRRVASVWATQEHGGCPVPCAVCIPEYSAGYNQSGRGSGIRIPGLGSRRKRIRAARSPCPTTQAAPAKHAAVIVIAPGMVAGAISIPQAATSDPRPNQTATARPSHDRPSRISPVPGTTTFIPTASTNRFTATDYTGCPRHSPALSAGSTDHRRQHLPATGVYP